MGLFPSGDAGGDGGHQVMVTVFFCSISGLKRQQERLSLIIFLDINILTDCSGGVGLAPL